MRLLRSLREALAKAKPDRAFSAGKSKLRPQLSERATGAEILLPGRVGMEALLALSSPAQFGRGAQTVRDPLVRKLHETEEAAVVWPALPAVLTDASRQLLLSPGLQLEARLHKVLSYAAGDHFDQFHSDSKREESHICTLAVDCGAGACKGGEIDFDGGESWTAEQAGDWCCWFATQQHRVRPVARGHRVIAIFNVLVHGDGAEPPATPRRSRSQHEEASEEEAWDEEVARLLAAPELAQECRAQGASRVGFLLRHRYSLDGLPTPPARRLRGRDDALHRAALAAGLRPELAPCELCLEYGAPGGGDAPDVLASVRIARGATGRAEYEDAWEQAAERAGREETSYGWDVCFSEEEEEEEGHVEEEVPPELRALAGTRVLSAGDVAHLDSHYWECDDEDGAKPVFWPFRDVAWACEAREAELVFKGGGGGSSGSGSGCTGLLWGNQAMHEIYWYRHVVMLVQLSEREPSDGESPFAPDLQARWPRAGGRPKRSRKGFPRRDGRES